MSAAASPTCTRSSRGALPHPAPYLWRWRRRATRGSRRARPAHSTTSPTHLPLILNAGAFRLLTAPRSPKTPGERGGCSLGPGAVEGGFESATPRTQGYADHACQRPTFASSQGAHTRGAEGRGLQQRVGAGGRVASVCREPHLCVLRDSMKALDEGALQCTLLVAGHPPSLTCEASGLPRAAAARCTPPHSGDDRAPGHLPARTNGGAVTPGVRCFFVPLQGFGPRCLERARSSRWRRYTPCQTGGRRCPTSCC